METYPELYSRLSYETAIVNFIKKDGTFRTMLCTRNLNSISLKYGFKGRELGGHDNRCNINNGNLAVFDLIIGEARSFNIDRCSGVQFLGVITTIEDMEHAFSVYSEYKKMCDDRLASPDLFNSIE